MRDETTTTAQAAKKRGLSRRDLLTGAAMTLTLGGLAGTRKASAQPLAPNIIYIVANDIGWADVGYNGSDIMTPNLDSLAKGGAQLEQFYTQPMCTPTRAALMTGRYPLRYGLQMGVIPGAGTYGIPLDEYLLPQALQDAGYATALVGKWHLGHAKPELWPKQRGFDQFYGALVGEIDHFKHSSHGVPDWYRDNTPIEEEGFDNTLFGDEAARVISEHNSAKPLFMFLAFTAPHTPYQAPQDYLDRYKDIEDENRRAYAAMISVMDDGVGKVVAELDKRGMREDTLIVFHSDNGGVLSSLFTGDTKVTGSLPASNGIYRDGKGTLYEGGTRVAAFANWPGHIPPGKVDEIIHVLDMYPTITGLAGAETTRNKPLDGLDVWRALAEGKPSPRNEIVYNVDPTVAAVRQGDWKLIWKAALPQRVELFNLRDDKTERYNLLADNPDIVAQLKARIEELAAEMAPPLLTMEAVRLTFYTPPVTADPSLLFSLGD